MDGIIELVDFSSPSKDENMKVIWMKITLPPGYVARTGLGDEAATPAHFEDFFRTQNTANGIVARISQNDFNIPTDGIKVYPFGWIELQETLGGIVEPVVPTEKTFTGTVEVHNLEPQIMSDIYRGKFAPYEAAIRQMFEPLINDVASLRVDYFQPTNSSSALGHFAFVQNPTSEKTSTELQQALEQGIEGITDAPENAVFRNPQLSTSRRFKATATSPLGLEAVDERLRTEEFANEFDKIPEFKRVEENDTIAFDFETSRNTAALPKDLETIINEELETDDAKVVIPGGDFLLPKPWLSLLYVDVSNETALAVLEDWKTTPVEATNIMERLPKGWSLDYSAARSSSQIYLAIFAEFDYSETLNRVNENFVGVEGITDYRTQLGRKFTGKVSGSTEILNSDGVDSTIKTLLFEMNANGFALSMYYLEYLNTEGERLTIVDSGNRKRRQATTEEQNIIFKFSGEPGVRLIPGEIQSVGRKLITDKLSTSLVADSLIIEPEMYEEGKTIPIPSTAEPTTTTASVSLSPATVTPTVVTKPQLPAISVYEKEGEVSEDELKELEKTISDRLGDDQDVNCESRSDVSSDVEKTVVQCKYKIDSDDKLGVTENIEPFTDIVQYMDNANAELCDNTFLNDCHADATCSSEGRNVVCSCNEGFEDQNTEKPGRSCVKKTDGILIFLIILIVVLFIVILVLAYFVHLKRTKTGIYHPSRQENRRNNS